MSYISYKDEIWHSYILEDLKKEEDLKKHINYMTHPMGFTDIIIVHQKSAFKIKVI